MLMTGGTLWVRTRSYRLTQRQIHLSRPVHQSAVAHSIQPPTSVESPAERSYFYWLSDRGRLYCIDRDEKRMPSGPAHLKDVKALNFFFSRVTRNDVGFYQQEFPWLSKCGRELNFVRSADRTPIIFFDLQVSSDASAEDKLLYGGNLEVTFHPESITVDASTGRFYHPLLPSKPHPIGSGHMGLLSSNIAVQLAPNLTHGDDGQLQIHWRGSFYRIPVS